MAHTLTLEVPEEVYDSLAKLEHEAGQSPEMLAAHYVEEATQLASDTLADLIGALHTDIPDWAEKHDYYIGMAALDTHADERGSISENG